MDESFGKGLFWVALAVAVLVVAYSAANALDAYTESTQRECAEEAGTDG